VSASLSVADAIVSLLNSHTFGVEFQAERNYADWDETLEEMDTLHVDVVPAGYKRAELVDRATTGFLCLVNIAVRKRFDLNEQLDDNRIDQDAIDDLVTLSEAIHSALATRRLDTPNYDPIWQETEMSLQFDRKALREHRQFTAILRVGFLVPVVNG
jgi:hypothetical protein